jgi:hypothetical protein
MLKKFLYSIAMTLCFVSAKAQTEEVAEEQTPTTTISGSVDAYYKYDFGESINNNKTSFTNAYNSFELGMASVRIAHTRSKVSMVADLGFGKRAKEFSYNDEGILAAVKQLYVSYAPAEWVKFTMGSWATHVGYEVVDPNLNRNYSMSYLFTNGPFTHTGLKADFTAGVHGFMVGVSNPTDFRTSPPTGLNRKFLLAQYSVGLGENSKAYLNYVGGKAPDESKTHQYDMVITSKVSDKFSLGLNGTVATVKAKGQRAYLDTKKWWGTALYVNVDPTEYFGLTLRGEYFSDKESLKIYSQSGNGGGSVFATTLSANFKIDNFIIIPEFRFDDASSNLFVNKNVNNKSAGNFILAAVYAF